MQAQGTGKDNDFPVAGVVYGGEGGPDAIYIWITKGSRDCNQRTAMGAISEQKVQSYTFVKQILENFLRLNRDLVARKSPRTLPWLYRRDTVL